MEFVDGPAAGGGGAGGRGGGSGYVAGSQGNFFDHGKIHYVRIVQASRGRSDNIQSEVMRTGEKWHWRVGTGDGGRKSHIDFVVAHDRNSSAERRHVVAIQADMQRSSAETGATNLHRTSDL